MNISFDIIEKKLMNTSPFGDGYLVAGVTDRGSTRVDFLMKNGSGEDSRMLRVTLADPGYGPASDECIELAKGLSPSLIRSVYGVIRREINGEEYCLAETDMSVSVSDIPLSGVLNMGIDICTALSELWDSGYLHRNVKPANISFHNGAYYLNSFDLMERAELCGPENYSGTPTHMAPETLENAEYGPSTDVYALGITMYSMLNDGKLPFEKAGYDVAEANGIRAAGTKIPYIPGIEPRFMNIVLKACEASPADRYANPSEMLSALRGYYIDRSRDLSNDLEYVMDELRSVPEFASRWCFESCLGAGAYGVVFRVTDRTNTEEPDRPYALKVISVPRFTDRAGVEELTDERQAGDYLDKLTAKTLDEIIIWDRLSGCRNTVRLLEYGKVRRPGSAHGCYCWMLSDLLSPIDGAVYDEKTVARIGYDIAAALADAHSCGIVHRDVKPSNILYSPEKGYLLGDFGVSKLHRGKASASRIGTINFMAPEILRAVVNDKKSACYDQTVDIYSLGMTMYTLLNNGLGPFMKDFSPGEQGKDETERCKPGAVFPDAKYPAENGKLKAVSEGMMRVIRKACAYDPEARYRSAEDMREAIENILLG